MTDRTLLLIEDTPSLQLVYQSVLRSAGHTVRCADDAASGLAVFRALEPPVVLLDLMLPDRDGLDLMREFLALRPETRVIVITANGSINKAVAAMRAGAHEFLVKPFDEQRFLAAIDNALADTEPAGLVQKARPETPAPGDFIGASEPMIQIYAKIRSVARSMATVFITGESGTGKELCAQAVHDMSNRAEAPFVPLNCGAIPTELLESEVFGHVKGAFTGAISDKPGAAAAADGGTLFLDEICELDLNLQTKLLRFLQTSTIQPVGATRSRKVNVRILCATNRDPLQEVRRGRFREDLYYRLNVVPIHMPPLRARKDDVPALIEHFLQMTCARDERRVKRVTQGAVTLLMQHDWPGNVRELKNVVERMVILTGDADVIGDQDVRDALPSVKPVKGAYQQGTPFKDLVAAAEREIILAALEAHDHHVSNTAKDLQLERSHLYKKMRALGIDHRADDGE